MLYFEEINHLTKISTWLIVAKAMCCASSSKFLVNASSFKEARSKAFLLTSVIISHCILGIFSTTSWTLLGANSSALAVKYE